jgi:DNA polymerase-3 subunit gamma/tau
VTRAEPAPAAGNSAPIAETEPPQLAAEPSATATPTGAPADGDPPPPASPSQGPSLGLVDVRQLWPGVLDRVKSIRRYAWVLLSQNAHVKAVDGNVLTIGMLNAGARDSFTRSGADEILHQALIDELGVDWSIDAIVDAEMPPPGRAGREPAAKDAAAAQPTQATPEHADDADDAGPPDWAVAAEPAAAPSRAAEAVAAKAAVRPMGAGGESSRTDPADDSEIAEDDAVVEEEALTDQELLARELGAEVIEDIRHEAG